MFHLERGSQTKESAGGSQAVSVRLLVANGSLAVNGLE
jgi:hypothetical protein